MVTELFTDVGTELEARRRAYGVTMREQAAALGIVYEVLSRIQNGRLGGVGNPSRATAERIRAEARELWPL